MDFLKNKIYNSGKNLVEMFDEDDDIQLVYLLHLTLPSPQGEGC